jgi:hypothetical protein
MHALLQPLRHAATAAAAFDRRHRRSIVGTS